MPPVVARVLVVMTGRPSLSAALLVLAACAGCSRDVAPVRPSPEPSAEPVVVLSSTPAPVPTPAASQPTPAAAEPARSADACAARALAALKQKDMSGLAAVVHPTRGVRFTPFAFVRPEDVVLHAPELRTALTDRKVHTWGQFGESEDPIKMTFSQYHARFVYDVDYARSVPAPAGTTDAREAASFNVASLRQTLREAYPKGSVFEYRVGPKTPDGIDWRVLRLVCEPEGEGHYLVGVVHSEWTP